MGKIDVIWETQTSTSASVGPTSTWEAKSSYNYSFPAPEIIKHTTERFLYFPLLTRAQFYGSKCSHAFSRDRRRGLDQIVMCFRVKCEFRLYKRL